MCTIMSWVNRTKGGTNKRRTKQNVSKRKETVSKGSITLTAKSIKFKLSENSLPYRSRNNAGKSQKLGFFR